jgi:hypothetical protein
MIEKLIPVKLPPGLYRNGTVYESKGRWYDGNLVRFIEGTIQPVGGWRTTQDSNGADLGAVTGVPRAMHAWRDSGGDIQIGIGTHSKAYVLINGTLTDITPASGFTAGDQDSEYASGLYGAGTYGTGIYGFGSLAAQLDEAGIWTLDNFGDYLVGVMTDDGDLWVWDGNTANDFALADASAPVSNRAVVVTPERFLVALGAGGNPRKVQWASQETTATWTASSSNTAGDFELATNGRIMCGARGRDNTLIWTDADLWAMTYIGGSLVYSFTKVGDSCGIIAPNAKAVVDGRAFWMGRDAFYAFDGFVKAIPCDVRDYVFEDFNTTQIIKTWAMPIAQYGEIWWFYPSAASTECDRYVVYNYREGHWSFGELARTAGFDRGATTLPMMATPAGVIKEHEVLEDRDSETPYLESGPFELADGDEVVKVQRIVPDENTAGEVNVTFYTAFYPQGTEYTKGPYTLSSPTSVRFTARQARMRLSQVSETSWRVGTFRLGVVPGGRR